MASKDPARPNVLFVITDDQGPWAMGCAGNSEIRTPNLDALAGLGVRFTNFFCSSPVCSPARATLMTGQLPSQHGVHDWLRGGNSGPDRVDYLEGRTLVTDILAGAGYRCGLVGKWHLGASDVPRKGFVHWCAHAAGMSQYFNAPFFQGTEAKVVEGYVSDFLGDEAIRFMESELNEDAPFWLNLGFTAPHSPWMDAHPVELTGLYEECAFASCPQEPRHPDSFCGNIEAEQGFAFPRENLIGYFAAVTGMDRALGRVLASLDRLGIRESTLVVFLSDNGMNCGHHGVWGKGNGTFPQNMYDSSVKVPCIFSQPGRLSEGSVVDAMGSGYDMLPTLVDYLGVPWKQPGNLPGRSLRQALEGQDALHSSDAVVVYDEYGPVRMIRTRTWKYVHRHPFGPHQLFDLVSDPGERFNLAGDPAHGATLERLRSDLEQWFAAHVEPAHNGAQLGVWGRGQAFPVGARGAGRDAFPESAPTGKFARNTYGDFVDIAQVNRKRA